MTVTIKQCKSCPWRVDCVPDSDIPDGYSRELHENLCDTIQSGERSLNAWLSGEIRSMACHYSKPGQEFACAGWLHNQLGVGNNIAVRLGVMSGRFPVPEIDGDQHQTFDATLPKKPTRKRRRR